MWSDGSQPSKGAQTGLVIIMFLYTLLGALFWAVPVAMLAGALGGTWWVWWLGTVILLPILCSINFLPGVIFDVTMFPLNVLTKNPWEK